MSPLKILYVITSLRTGGAERLVAQLSKQLLARGHQVEILVFDATPTTLMQELEIAGIKIHKAGKGLHQIYNPINIFKIRRLERNYHYDIIHSHNSSAQLFLALAGVGNLSKLVTTEHNSSNRRRNLPFLKPFERFVYKKYDAVVSVSNQVRENLLNYLGLKDSEKIRNKNPLIYNGVDLTELLRIENTPSNTNVILMVSSFRKQKDHATAIKAMKYLDDNFELWLAGEGETKKECENLAEKLKISHKIRFLGEFKDVSSLISQAKIVILSTNYEGMPLSAIEAMAAGKPFIGSNVDGVREVVGDAGILFERGNSRDLANKIKQLIYSPQDYDTVAKKCRETALNFDIKNTLAEHEKLYHALASTSFDK